MEGAVARLVAGLERGMAYVTALASVDMTIEWISPSVRDLTGWTAEQLIGANAIEFVHPDDLPSVARLVEAERNDPHPYGVDPARFTVNRIRFRSADGGWRSLDIAANNQIENPAVRGFVFIMSETTVQRLKDEIYDAMASGEPIGVIASKVAELVSWQTEHSFVQATARGLAEGVAGEHRAGTELIAVELGDVVVAAEHPADLAPSEWFRLLLDRAVGLLNVAVTRHHGEQALRRRIDEKTAIISAVSHDLRSPIAAIQLMSTLLGGNGDTLTDDQRRELVTRINADAQRTSRLLADLTSVDRLLHGSTEPSLQRVALWPLIGRVLADLDADGRAVTSTPPVDEAAIHADPVLT
ncbi:MAG: PAS domain-containing protein [Actinobacteria bacterium]|nr:PAS domain-containing protein [Actinomycetota bacterium]